MSLSAIAESESRGAASRLMLLRRLTDVVAMPASRLPPQDRSMAGDVLLEILFEVTDEERYLCAKRLVPTFEAPRRVLRYLGQCSVYVAEHLLLENESFDDSDLTFIIEHSTPDHWCLIAQRKTVGASVCDRLVRTGDVDTLRTLLKNRRSFISETAVDEIVNLSREYNDLADLLIHREELKPSQALAMFWWSNADVRRQILTRFSADRAELIDTCMDVFAKAAAQGWSDPVVRKTLQLIERRQRNRAAIDKSPYDSLEHAVEVAAVSGINREIAEEIAYLSGIKPITMAKLFTDEGGEGIAILCKATGLKRDYLSQLWTAMKRPLLGDDGENHPKYNRVLETFEIMTSAKAQTTLRYWNWSLSSSFNPRAQVGLGAPDEEDLGFSSSRRTAHLVFGS